MKRADVSRNFVSRALQLVIWLTILAFAACNLTPPTSHSPVSRPLPTVVDYFPLNVGNKWTYAFSFYNRSGGGPPPGKVAWKVDYKGTSTWEIVSMSLSPGCTHYTFQETINCSLIQMYDSRYPNDTLTISDAKFTFVISDSTIYGMRMEFYPDSSGSESPNHYLASEIADLGVKRFQLMSSPVDTAYYGGGYQHVNLVRSVGISEFGWYVMAMSQVDALATLQSYELK